MVAELLAVAGVCVDYPALDEGRRVAALTAELRWPRPLRSPFAAYSELTTSEPDVLAAAATAIERFGTGAIPHHVISGADSVSDVLEVAVLLREVGLVRPAEPAPSAIDIVPLFETIDDLHRCHHVLAALLDHPLYARIVAGRGGRQEVGTPTPTRTAATWPPTGRRHERRCASSTSPGRAGCGSGCSTVAAGPSGAAAVRRTRRSSPSPPARSTGSCASPNRARWLAGNPTLARSIRNRYPYLDPLHVLQVELLRRHRTGDHDDLVERGIQLTLNAIATGLRNSG